MKMIKYEKHNETGITAIIITGLIMVILSLITIGFARLMQREQRQALDTQLSRQALLAAESGINDTRAYIEANADSIPESKEDCDVSDISDWALGAGDGVIDAEADVAYTCIQYDNTPSELTYQTDGVSSVLTKLQNTTGTSLETVTYNWSLDIDGSSVTPAQSMAALPDCGTVTSGTPHFPPSRTNTVPVLKIDLTDISTLSREFFYNNTAYLYLSPCSGGSGTDTFTFTSNATPPGAENMRGRVFGVPCDASGECEFTVTNLNGTSYLNRIKSIYEEALVNITSQSGGGGAADFDGAQTTIDVTGRAADVVRRLRVSVGATGNVTSNQLLPEGAIQLSQEFCKLSQYYNIQSGPPFGTTFRDTCVEPVIEYSNRY